MDVNQKIPNHIAIVMDGNGRWAAKRSLPRVAGHQAGAKAIRNVIECCVQKKISALSLFAFSCENWGRPVDEVDFLMKLFLQTLQSETKKLHEHNIKIQFIGDRTAFNKKLQEKMHNAEQLTQANTGLDLVLAVNYSGRWDIEEATRKIAREIELGKFNSSAINSSLYAKYLCLNHLPEPDLLIRTSGEQRISNFMLWQFAYTELYFTDILWPDFDATAFKEALKSYANRERRFGIIPPKKEIIC